ncbi:MAG: SUMF1/EgtB/PvdO family nonheme iron enzyme [Deltaproteobacteria bacterium]|nr:SUMF1/EgtB/PvdO family nonheme iron enzyme [Deltaproteobacteria bacterium]
MSRRVRAGDPRRSWRVSARPEPSRYSIIGELGRGGAGEVLRVHDHALERIVALKTLRPELQADRVMLARFVHEAQIVAQIEHPAIVPVYDLGRLADGRWYLTMKEINGRTFREVIANLHRARGQGAFVPTVDGWTLRRAVEAMRTVCEAAGFAHSKSVIHRDIKPDNVMVGNFGEVYLLDWGLARLVDGDEAARDDEQPEDEDLAPLVSHTHHGVVVGTPAYMPPEQARGERELMSPASDVWALGAVLYALLFGRAPYRGEPQVILQKVQEAPPRVPTRVPAPAALVEICLRCMRLDPRQRYADGAAVAAELTAWLEGARSRERALTLTDQARAVLPLIEAAEVRAAQARERARAAVVGLRPGDTLEVKEAAWGLEEEAQRQSDEVQGLYVEAGTRARSALEQAPELPEARALLAALSRRRAEAAELQGDLKAAREHQAMLAAYDDGTHADYLAAEATLQLRLIPAHATARVHLFGLRSRRLQAGPAQELPPVDGRGWRLPVGSYLLEVEAPGYAAVRYPFQLRRGQDWQATAPGQAEPTPLSLPREGWILPFERVVPAGWFWSGGDPEAPGALPRQRVWVPSFCVAMRPVSHHDYIAWVNDLATTAGHEAALDRVPRLREPGTAEDQPLYRWDPAAGRYRMPRRVAGLQLDLSAPVIGVRWGDAAAYVQWLAAKTGFPFRLLGELEWEKAARGVDGRRFPWGDQEDPAFMCMQDSAAAADGPPIPTATPVDCSPYGVLGMAGGVQDWCAEPFSAAGPPRRGSAAVVPAALSAADLVGPALSLRRSVRGGAWNLPARSARSAARTGVVGDKRSEQISFRVARSLDLPGGG